MSSDEQLRYPIGKFQRPTGPLDSEARPACISQLERTPSELRELLVGASDAKLDTSYRPGGWTVRQVIHHLADSHMNAYIRMKLAVTEDAPTIKPYNEADWAELPDARSLLVEVSLELLDALHFRWANFLRSLGEADFQRTYVHPERGPSTLDVAVALYSWHGRHHTAHVRSVVGEAGLGEP